MWHSAALTPHQQLGNHHQARTPDVNNRLAILPSAIRPASIWVALVLGLLAMHILGVDHQVTHGIPGSAHPCRRSPCISCGEFPG